MAIYLQIPGQETPCYFFEKSVLKSILGDEPFPYGGSDSSSCQLESGPADSVTFDPGGGFYALHGSNRVFHAALPE